MTEPRNEFDFEQWYVENAFDYCKDPIGSRDCGLQRTAWHAAIDAIRAKLAGKELWIAPMVADDEMKAASNEKYRFDKKATSGDLFIAMRDSYIAYYGQDFGLDP